MPRWISTFRRCASAAVWLVAPVMAQQPTARALSTMRPEDIFGLSAAGDVQIAPDGARVAYVRSSNDVMIDRARTSIWFVDTRSGAETPLPGVAPSTDVSQPRWSPTGDRLAFVGQPTGASAGIYVYSAATGRTALIASAARRPGQLTWSPNGREIAFVMSTPQAAETLGHPLKKPDGAVWAEPLRITARVEYKRDGEGERKPGYAHVYVVSADSGGPGQLTFGSFDDSGPLSWTPDGKSLLFTSRRGPDWERERDLYAIYRVKVLDGALTAWIVGKTSRFKAAVAQAPVIDWTSESLTVDFFPWMSKQWFGTLPWEDHELLWKHSPLSLVGNVTTPTMLIVGDVDMRTPPGQAEEFYGALQIRGVPTTLIKIPGAYHATISARPSQSAARVNAIVAWFARYDAAMPRP